MIFQLGQWGHATQASNSRTLQEQPRATPDNQRGGIAELPGRFSLFGRMYAGPLITIAYERNSLRGRDVARHRASHRFFKFSLAPRHPRRRT